MIPTFICFICAQPFQRYSSQISNDAPTCSLKCLAEKYKISLLGKNNPNYRDGKHCEKSLCKCGKEKDQRAILCARCSRCGFPKDKTSLISDSEIINAIKNSKTILEAASKLPLSRTAICKFIKEGNVNISHFKKCKGREYSLEEIFSKGAQRRNFTVKKHLIEKNLIPYECLHCKNNGTWNDIKLVLELDHINGDPLDNNLANLRFLCPNCHSQTNTSKGKNSKNIKKKHKKNK